MKAKLEKNINELQPDMADIKRIWENILSECGIESPEDR